MFYLFFFDCKIWNPVTLKCFDLLETYDVSCKSAKQYQTLTFQELGSSFSVPYCMNDPYSSTKNSDCSGMSEWILVYLLILDKPETSFFLISGWRPYQQKGPLFIIFLVQTAPTASYALILQHICSHCTMWDFSWNFLDSKNLSNGLELSFEEKRVDKP